jgi:molybdate transport system ATP-binding protein
MKGYICDDGLHSNSIDLIMKIQSWAILTDTSSPVRNLLDSLIDGPLPKGFETLEGKKGALFSTTKIINFIEEEIRHDEKILTRDSPQSLESMSSGERKKLLFKHLLLENPDYLILDNPFDNLDTESRQYLSNKFQELSSDLPLVQILTRKADMLPFIERYAEWREDRLVWLDDIPGIASIKNDAPVHFSQPLPPPLEAVTHADSPLVVLSNVSVSYGHKPVLKKISWEISPADFWELRGVNGSGKTTLLSLITGDNPKAFGQEIYLFGQKKGSGESVWDIKKNIGYITPALTDRFRGYHSLEHMLISGLVDSIGLYTKPTDRQKKLAASWLSLLGMIHKKNTYFHDLSKGEQRLVMCARAMIKQPQLLILDEPTADLDDRGAELVVHLVNKLGNESETAIVFVSHRKEPGLNPGKILELVPSGQGSVGRILT